MSDDNPQISLNQAALVELAAVKGQLSLITTLLTNQHASTNQRIDDMRRSMEGSMDSIEKRLTTLETNERGTAIRTAGVSAITSAIVAASVALLRNGGH